MLRIYHVNAEDMAMEKRLRSPNYPALSLPDAIEKVGMLYRAQHTHAAPREIVAKGMGYNTLNGASATAISALHKYGLLDRIGEEIKVSDRAMRILHPHSPRERGKAIQEAAYEPPLFAELRERFPGQMPSDDLLRNFLIRNGFAPAALTPVMLAYRETSEMAEREGRAHDSPREQAQEHAAMPSQSSAALAGEGHLAADARTSQPQPGPLVAIMEDHIVVNMVLRTRDKARALRHMIEMVEGMLPEPEPVSVGKAIVSEDVTNATVTEPNDGASPAAPGSNADSGEHIPN
jgi:hypothetical protein